MSTKHIKTLNTDYDEMKEKNEYSQEIHHKTSIRMLQEHNGYRPGNFHLFLAPSGGGKSTTFRTLLYDTIRHLDAHEKVGVWLSEESRSELLAQLAFDEARKGLIVGNEQILFYSEQDLEDGIKTFKQKLEALQEMIESCDIVYLDNITTSGLYNDRDDQSAVMNLVKAKCEAENTALIMFAHTRKGFSRDKMIEQDDIRGNGTINGLCQYYYIIQRMNINKRIETVIKIEKNRNKSINNTYFIMTFDKDTRLFSDTNPIAFSDFNIIFQQRDSFKKATADSVDDLKKRRMLEQW